MTALATLRAVDAVTTDAALRLAVLRLTGEMELYQRLYRDLFAAACVHIAEKQKLERMLAETRDELRRITARECQP